MLLNKIKKCLQLHPFHLVDPSPWPFYASLSIFGCTIGGTMYIHSYKTNFIFITSLFFLLSSMFVWWRDIIREANFEGHHTGTVQDGLRYGMILFIVSEILFFLAFFWAFFHSSLSPTIEIGSMWPPKGINVLSPWEIPFFNTLILLLSGCTITWTHHSIVTKLRTQSIFSLALTIFLAIVFISLQIIEYTLASFRLSDGIYGSTFYMATGFHGFHVLIGMLFILICFIRLFKYQLTCQHHFGFEAAAWYWHFVDVVWLFLFISIYWWGGL